MWRGFRFFPDGSPGSTFGGLHGDLGERQDEDVARLVARYGNDPSCKNNGSWQLVYRDWTVILAIGRHSTKGREFILWVKE